MKICIVSRSVETQSISSLMSTWDESFEHLSHVKWHSTCFDIINVDKALTTQCNLSDSMCSFRKKSLKNVPLRRGLLKTPLIAFYFKFRGVLEHHLSRFKRRAERASKLSALTKHPQNSVTSAIACALSDAVHMKSCGNDPMEKVPRVAFC